MLSSYLLSLREGLEAALIIGIVIGALRKIRRADLASAAWFGAFSAVIVSILSAILLANFGVSLAGNAEKIFEGFTMLIAAALLTWMIFWMSRQSRTLKSDLEEGVNMAVVSTGRRGIFWLAFAAVVREGIELALFLTAAFFVGGQSQVTANTAQTLAGALLGLGTALLLGWTFLATTVRLDLHRFFQVTGVLLILFAAGLISSGVHEFNEAGWIPAIIGQVWDMNRIVDERSLPGQLLKTLFGYNGNPSLTEMLAYFAYLAVVVISLRHTSSNVNANAAQAQE